MIPEPSRDRGSMSAFVVCLALAFLMLAGLSVDGGRLVAARTRAADLAENAARAGAQEIVDIRAGVRRVDPVAARRTASAYLAAHGVDGSVTVAGNRVVVTVEITQRPTLLRLAGVTSRTVRATRSSEPIST